MPLSLVPPRKGRSQNWRIRGTVRGRTIDETTGVARKDLAEVIRIRREQELLDESIYGARASRRFAEAAIAYVEAQDPGRTQREAIIGRQRADGSISPSLLSWFGGSLCSAIDQAMVDRVALTQFRGRSPATVQRSLITPLVSVLTFAARRGWCDRPEFWRPPPERGRTRWATREEAERLLEASTYPVSELLLFLVMTGARMSEALGLGWQDVSLADRWAVLRNTKRNREDRGIPLHRQVVTALANLPHRDGEVFRTPRGLPYAPRAGGGQIKTAWAGTLRRAGIQDLRPHDLRHTFSTWLTMAGVHEQVRDEIMGHASTSMGRRYSHVPRAELLRAVDRLPLLRVSRVLFVEQDLLSWMDGNESKGL